MNARRVTAAAKVIAAALVGRDSSGAGIAAALEAAQLLQSPETAAEQLALREQYDQLDKISDEVMAERDAHSDALDRFALAVAPEEVIGEHSSGNNPWANAFELVTPAAEVDALRARLAELTAASPWERAVAGLNALVDADVAFWIEPDGHISGPFSDEHIEWDQAASRWRLVHDDEDDEHPPHPAPCRVPSSPDCTCPVNEEQARRIERDRPETNTSHDCNLPLTRRLDCGHCPHEVCQDCDRCPHTCRCASPDDDSHEADSKAVSS